MGESGPDGVERTAGRQPVAAPRHCRRRLIPKFETEALLNFLRASDSAMRIGSGLEVEGLEWDLLRGDQQLTKKFKTWRAAIEGFFSG
jgi:hypothetical protein